MRNLLYKNYMYRGEVVIVTHVSNYTYSVYVKSYNTGNISIVEPDDLTIICPLIEALYDEEA
jgi:hypothetical protein